MASVFLSPCQLLGQQMRDFPLFSPSFASNERELCSYCRKSTISYHNWFLSSALCERKAWDEILCLFRYDFCFLTILTDVFVWCSGWDPTAFTWQPGNQSFTVAMVTRGGREKSILSQLLCPFLEAYRIFRQRSLWTQQQQQQQQQMPVGIKTAVSWHHKTSCRGGCGWGKHHKEAKGVAFCAQSSGCWLGLWASL